MNTKLALLPLVAVLALLLAACSSSPNARGYVQGKAGIQAFNGDTPITSPYEIDGNIKFKLQPTKPVLTIEVLDPATTIRTTVSGVQGRIDGSGSTDNGNTLIIRK